MENNSLKKLPSDFSLERFARVYVEEALKAAQGNPPIQLFDNLVYVNVAWRTGVSPELVSYLSNPFHWEFFCYSNGDSILGYKQVTARDGSFSGTNGSYGRVILRREPNSQDVDYLVDLVLNGSPESRIQSNGLYFRSSTDGDGKDAAQGNDRRQLFQSRIDRLNSNGHYDGGFDVLNFDEWRKSVGCGT